MGVKDFASTGERKQITAVFIDLVGFSEVASTADAEDLQFWLENYYHQTRDIIEDNDGEVTEYLGDGVVAIFGLTRADELAAAKAVNAALKAVNQISTGFMGRAPLKLRAGVATGEVAVRADTRRDALPRVTGMVTTLAQRVQEHASAGTVMISQNTRDLLRNTFHVVEFSNQNLKGFAESVTLFRAESYVAATGIPQQSSFVGRGHEQAEIAATSAPSLIVGPAGIGKSALSAIFTNTVQACAFLQADGVNTGSSYQPFKDWILSHVGRSPLNYRNICQSFPTLNSQSQRSLALIMGLPEGLRLLSELSNLALKSRIETSIWQAIQSVMPQGLLVFEDLHWFDTASFGVLQTILRDPQTEGYKILMTSREDVKISQNLGDFPIHILTLNELDTIESGKMLDALSPTGLTQDLRQQLIDRSGGIPLFLEQLIKRCETGAADFTAIPETLMDLLAERIDATGSAKLILQRASAIGRVFSHAMLVAIDPEGHDPIRALERGLQLGVLQKRSDTDWAFSHALLQEAAYQSLLRATREALHARIAEVLSTEFSESVARDPALLAEHQNRAKLLVPAIQSYLAASQMALMQGAFQDAESHTRTALSLCHEGSKASDLSDLAIACHTALGSILMQVQGYTAEPVCDAFNAVHDIARAQPVRTQDSAAALFGSFSHAIVSGDKARADDFCDLLSQIATAAPAGKQRSEVRLAALAAKSCLCFYQGEFTTQFEQMAKIRVLYERENHSHMMARYGMDIFAAAQMFELNANAICGNAEQVMPLLEETDRHQAALDVPVMQPYALIWGALSLFYIGQTENALIRLRRGLGIADEQGAAFWQSTGQVWLYVIDETASADNEGLEKFRAQITMQRAIGANVGGAYFDAVFSTALARHDRNEEAYICSLAAKKETKRSGLLCWYTEILRLHAGNCKKTGRLEEAETALRAAITVATEQGAGLWRIRAALDLTASAQNSSSELADALADFPENMALPEIARAKTILGRI